MENLSFICGGLGIVEEDDDGNQIGYTPGEYCLDNLKDLLRFLRRDDPETREVFNQVCKWNIVGKDILPIIQHHQNDTTLLLNAVKVLVFLTMPIDPTSKDIPQQIEYLWGLKSLITLSHAIPVIVTLLESPLENLEGNSFTEDDWKLVQLVVTLFRNILAVQDITTQQRVAGLSSEFVLLRDRFLELLFEENVMDLILVFTQHVGGPSGVFRQDNLLLLETFYYIYKSQVPELIARAHLDTTKVEREAEATVNDLKSLMEEEKEKRRQKMLVNMGARSKFTGSFTRVTMDGSKVLVKGNPCSDSHDSFLKGHKNSRDASKKMPWDSGKMPTTNKNILRLLHDFTNQFLQGGYNVLMQSIREDIEKEHHAIENSDVVTFFQVAEFIMSFQNHKLLASKPDGEVKVSESIKEHDDDSTLFEGNICGAISETMNEPMFLLVVSKWRSAFDGLKETNDYKFLSAAGSLMKTMINMLDLVLKLSSDDSREPQTARVLLYKLFYDQTDQGMTYFLFNLIKTFNAHKQPKSDLADLVETIHIVIRLMENLQSRGTLRVAKKSRRKRKKKPSTTNKDTKIADQDSLHNNDSVPTSENTENVNMPVKETSPGPNLDKTGDDDIIPENDDIMHEEINQPDATNVESKETGVNNDYVSDDSSSDEEQDARNEVDFKASSLVSSLANNTIIQNLCWLLKFYRSNSVRTNHYIICALRRICEDLELSPMLYQLSLLTIFHTILEEQKSSPSKEHNNIVLFLTDLVRRMLRKMKSYPLLFVEVLFWKTRKECHYINCESMLQDFGRNGYRKRGNDNNTHDGDVGTSGGSNSWVRKSMADALGDDEADVVVPPWRDDDQSEENPNGEGTENINEGTETMEHSVKTRKRLKPLVLTDELEEKLKELFEKYKELPDCSQRIVTELNLEVSPAQVSKKLKELGLRFPLKKRMSKKNNDDSNVHEKDMDASLQQPSFARKRIRALSEDQEMKIRTLFEQFKDHKKCSQMIASALEGEVRFTAAQITRKLTQLGLRLKKQRSNNNNNNNNNNKEMHLRDEDADDGETLLSLKKRSKTKVSTEETPDENSNQLSDDDDDDDIVLSFIRSKKKQNSDGNSIQLSDDDSDDDVVLSLAAFKTKKKQSKVTDENSNQLSDDDDDDDIVLSSVRNGNKRLSRTRAPESKDNLVIDNNVEEDIKVDSGGQKDVIMTEIVDDMDDHQLNDDVADDVIMDFGNNESLVMSQKAGGPRRKLRMVLDDED